MKQSITFNIATLNDEKRLEKCLYYIKKLNYNHKKIKINVIDGGSKDKTLKIAKHYRCNIIHNKYVLAEPALYLGYKNSKTEYAVYMATDNILFDKNWLIKILKPFEYNDQVKISFSRVSLDNDDNIWSNYLNEDTDPFNRFVYGNSSHPNKFIKCYEVLYRNKDFEIYDFKNKKNYPLIALAQCTVVKCNLVRNNLYDDIQDIINYINKGYLIAYVKNTSIYHYSLSGFLDFYKKFERRIKISLKYNNFKNRDKYTSKARILKKYIFLLYSVSVIFPLWDSLVKYMRGKNSCSFIHPIACLTITFLIIKNIILKNK
jgi:hypothetical protein